ncbi:MAG: hypothetical protein IH974_03980, partial [Myxococcales bacterium]|nr:hypothetical protein [Myxococcales bacterium]
APASAADDRPRVLYVSSNGAGVGHLMRLMSMARRAERTQPLFLTLSQAITVVREQGYPVEYLASRQVTDVPVTAWHRLLRDRVLDLVDAHDVRAIVFDGTWPYRGLFHVVHERPHVHLVWSRRAMWREGVTNPMLDEADRFSLILEPGEAAADLDVGVTTRLRDGARRVGPITFLDTAEQVDRATARAEMGLDPDRPAALVQLGAGNINDTSSLLGMVVDALSEAPDLQICVTRSVIASEAEQLGVDLGVMILAGCVVGFFPAAFGFLYAHWASRRWELPLRESAEFSLKDLDELSSRDESQLPPFWLSLLPILLPVVLIAGFTILKMLVKQYGYDNMHQYRNWRWYKKYSGGPIADLGSHQIDVFNWILKARPKSVMASGGTDYYKCEWYDNIMAIYEYETAAGPVRGFYQVLNTTSHGGFYETFMGDQGSITISEDARKGQFFREVHAKRREWEAESETKEVEGREAFELKIGETLAPDGTKDPEGQRLLAESRKPVHQLHLENFFNAIRTGSPLSCPPEIGYETAVSVLKVNEALAAGRRLEFAPNEFVVA